MHYSKHALAVPLLTVARAFLRAPRRSPPAAAFASDRATSAGSWAVAKDLRPVS